MSFSPTTSILVFISCRPTSQACESWPRRVVRRWPSESSKRGLRHSRNDAKQRELKHPDNCCALLRLVLAPLQILRSGLACNRAQLVRLCREGKDRLARSRPVQTSHSCTGGLFSTHTIQQSLCFVPERSYRFNHDDDAFFFGSVAFLADNGSLNNVPSVARKDSKRLNQQVL